MSQTALYRSFEGADLELRDGRTVVGIFIPYSQVAQIDANLREEFLPGAFARQVAAFDRGATSGRLPSIPFGNGHLGPQGKLPGKLVGKVTALREDAAGLYGEARISATRDGDELLTLLNDEVLRQLSGGFYEGQNVRRPDGLVQRRSATLFEAAAVFRGAYGEGARVLALRHEEESRERLDRSRAALAKLPELK